jgi:predicted lipoprotein with Yx(FWY)xxD motif
VWVKTVGSAGQVLVDSRGRALYVNDQERGGMAHCTGACFSFWRPLTVSGTPKASGLPGKLSVVKRPGGGRQVTFNGYHFTWHVAHPTKSVVSSGGTTVTNPYGY